MNESIEKSNNVSIIPSFAIPPFIVVMFFYFLQNLNFIKSCFHIMRRAFLNFDCNIGFVFEIFAEPYS